MEDYRHEVLQQIRPLPPLRTELEAVHGRVLAEDVRAAESVPGFANSAMDGYAVRAADFDVDRRELRVVGEVAAGTERLPDPGPGEAVRIMTGAPVPAAADAVVPVEVTSEDGDIVRIDVPPTRGDHIRPAGESVEAGEMLLRAGRRLRAADIGMLAAVGRADVLVHPAPRVAVLSTGDELVEPGLPLRPGQIRDSNSFMLTALAHDAGAVASRQTLVADDEDALRTAFEAALDDVDLLVTSGGVSAGRYDYVKVVLGRLGDVAFNRVAMRPGMPQAFGFVNGVACFALPGNPVSAFVSFEVFVRPALRILQGRDDLWRPKVRAVLDEPLVSAAHKTEFVRVLLHRSDGVWHARSTGAQGSGILRSVVDADGLAEIPADWTDVGVGETVVVHLLVEP